MKRLLISISGATLIVFFLVAGFLLGAYIFRQRHGPSWIVTLFYFLLAWPLWIFAPIFGTYQSGLSDQAPNPSALGATLFTHLAVYSLLIYAALRWRGGRKRSQERNPYQ